MEAIYARFGRQLRRVRKQRKMTQAELGDLVRLGRTSIVNIETGHQRVHLHTLFALAAALGVSPTELLPEEPVDTGEVPPQLQGLPIAERDWVMRRLASVTEGRSIERNSRGSAS